MDSAHALLDLLLLRCIVLFSILATVFCCILALRGSHFHDDAWHLPMLLAVSWAAVLKLQEASAPQQAKLL